MECEDKKCPFHGELKTRGAVLIGKIVSNKAKNTAIIERQYLQYIPKYERYERRKTRIPAHVPSCIKIKNGDEVEISECRKLSKTKNFVVTKVEGNKK